RSAAVLWAVAFHLKLYTGLFLVPLFLIGRRRLAISALAVFVVLLALPLPWTGFEAPQAYLGSLAEEAGGSFTVFYNQISIPAALARLARTPADWVSSNRPVESLPLRVLVWLSLAGFGWGAWKLRRDPTRALALTIPYLLLFLPKMWDHGQLLFFGLFVLAALPRRYEGFIAGYLILSLSYFPLVQYMLGQALEGKTAPLQVQGLLLFFPLLNLLAAVALVQDRDSKTIAA
ncbi:MAG: glycosyltransferase family 87 protein, partial [Thermoanaerobaculia bacterium]